MSSPEAEPGNARPFALVASLMIADEKGDYERAVDSQRQLKALGWHVSRKPPEKPKPSRRKRPRVNA
jgi:hypothetical protein